MNKLFHNTKLLYPIIITICFFYTGSAYMSQMYLLMDYYSDVTVDLITSGINYGLQAAGMLLFMLGIKYIPNIFCRKNTFLILIILGIPCMAAMLLIPNGLYMVLYGLLFHLLVGFYFGYYLTMLAAFVDQSHIGLAYGISYAIASVGTYLVSLIGEGQFLTSSTIVILYILLGCVTAILVYFAEDIPVTPSTKPASNTDPSVTSMNGKSPDTPEGSHNRSQSLDSMKEQSELRSTILWLSIIILLMSIVSSIGSGLYLSLPGTENANFTLARAFYAIGLIAAGIIIDKNRQLGGILTLASLTYPLIATSILYSGQNGTFAMCLSYLFLGFLAVYRVTVFADLEKEKVHLLPITGLGLMISRCVDVVITILLEYISLSFMAQLLITMVIYSVVLILFIFFLLRKKTKEEEPAPSTDSLLANFAERYALTARETEVLSCIKDGLTDNEIAEKCFISKSTVRFHVSNLMKKTECSSRVEVVRKFMQNK